MASLSTYMIVLLLPLVLFHEVNGGVEFPPAISCPDSCSCPNRLLANCSSGAWRSLPLGLSNELRVLHMSNNSLLKLENDTFFHSPMPYLNVMYLQQNRINYVHKLALNGLKILRFLYLDRNRIETFDTEVFSFNNRLEVLGLSYNPLRFPKRGPFIKSESIQILDLSRCNFSWIPKETFVGLPALVELRISHNLLSSIDVELFLHLQALKYLYISHNNLSKIPQDLFLYSTSLEVLDLSNNRLIDLDSFVFHHLIDLQVLYLQSNNLSFIHEDVFHSLSNLTELHLQNNNIEGITTDVFRSTANLKLLYLDNNDIENLTREALVSLQALTHLYISNNNLRSFHLRLVCDLSNLRFLRLYGNPLSCSCELKALWEWSFHQEVKVRGSCIPEGLGQSNSSVYLYLAQLTCNQTSCAAEIVVEQEDTFLLLVYILSGVCPLVLVMICSILTVCAFKNHRKNIQEQEVSYNMTTSSTGYLMQEQVASGSQMYSSGELQNLGPCEYPMQTSPLKECSHVSPYSVSPVLYKEETLCNPGPPPIPAMPPRELLSNSAYALPLGYVREPIPTRSRAFSTSEEEESRPLMRSHHGTLPAASRSSSFRTRQTARRVRPRRQLGNLSSDTEPCSSYSEDASDTVSVTQCEMATWSGSEASTHVVSEHNMDTLRV